MSGKFHDYMARRQTPGGLALDRQLSVTLFASHAASTKTERTVSLRDLVDSFRTTRAETKAALPWLKLATFGENRTEKGSFRHDANLLRIDGIEADYDGGQVTVDRAKQILAGANVAAVIYTSPSHTEGNPRWRVLCPTSMPLDPETRTMLVARVNGLFVGALARESFTLSQSYYYGYVDGAQHHTVVTVDGRAIDLADDLDAHAVNRPARPVPAIVPQIRQTLTLSGGTAYGLAALDNECQAIRSAGDGSKHDTLNKAAYAIGGLVAGGDLDHGTAMAGLSDALASIQGACKDFKAAQRTLQNSFRDGMGQPRSAPELPPEPVHPAAALIAKMHARTAQAAAKPLPIAPGLMDVDGALKLFVEHCEATAISPQPFLALAAGICAIGALAGRRYRTRTNLRTNIYAVGIADSGGGKDHARKRIKAVLGAAGLTRYLGGEDVASGAGMLSALARHPAILFQIDEFGDWLAGVLGNKAPTHKRQIAERFKTLYSSADSWIAGTEYADQSDKGRRREDIQQPHACLYGTTTPGQFWAAIASGSMHDGLLARVLIFLSPVSYPDERDAETVDPPSELVAAFQAIAEGAPTEGNLGTLMASGVGPEPYLVHASSNAELAIKALRGEQLAMQRQAEGTYVTAIAARWAENAIKLALVRAVSRSPSAPVIGAQDVVWGRAIAKHCIDTLLQDAERYVSDNDYDRRCNKAIEIIRKHGPVSEHKMQDRYGWKFPPRERAEALRDLVARGRIVVLPTEPGKAGRPTVRYAINGQIGFPDD